MSDLHNLVELYKTSGLSSKEAIEKAEGKEAFYLEKEDRKRAFELEKEDRERAFKLELERIKLEQIKQSGINAGEL